MSKRAERKTPRKLLANYSNIQQQFHRIFRVLYHLSVSKRIRDSVPRPLTSLQAMRLLDLRERPNEIHRTSKQDYRVKKLSQKPSVMHKPRTVGPQTGRTGDSWRSKSQQNSLKLASQGFCSRDVKNVGFDHGW